MADSDTPTVQAQAPKPKMLQEPEFTLTEAVQVMQTATPAAGTTREDVLKPMFWAHVARHMAPMNEIRVVPKDGKWYGRYFVVYADRFQARVVELEYKNLEASTPAASATSEYLVKWISPPVRYGVVRKADGEVVKNGFQTEADASKWMIQYANTTAKVPAA